MLRIGHTTSKDLERLIGNLEVAAWVEPVGRPPLPFISREITPNQPRPHITLPYVTRVAMRICLRLLQRNRGLRHAYILNALPAERRRIVVDAAPTGGIGGYASYTYYSVSLLRLTSHWRRCEGRSAFPRVDIAWLELFAAFVAIDLSAARSPGQVVLLFSHNTNVAAWLTPRRSPNHFVCTRVSAIERLKYKFMLKLSVRYFPSAHNVSADLLSRNTIPIRFVRQGTRVFFQDLFRLRPYLNIKSLANNWSHTLVSSPLHL